ncbi:MAG: S9 family peptidase [Acidobacteria bacterium]|nr:S9 family peptidase [Acidobacteriota bacterium]
MRIKLLAVALASLSFVFARSPEDRTVTDPQSIASVKNDKARPIPIEDLFVTRSITGGSWSPDGKEIVFSTNMTGRLNLWKVESAGGWPVQLAVSEDRQTGGMWTPDGKWILWQQDGGGNEQWDVFGIPAAGGAPVNLTATPEISESGQLVSPDSTRLAVNYKPKSASVTDVAVLDLAKKTVRNLTNDKSADRTWAVVAWSPDGKSIYANRQNPDGTVGEVWRIDAASGALENLTPNVKPVSVQANALSPDGKTLLVTSNEKGGFDNVALIDIATKKQTWITDLKWEATGDDFSPDGKWVAYSINEDGQSNVFLSPVGSNSPAQRLELPKGINSAVGTTGVFSPKGDKLLVSHQSSITPNDYWLYDLETRKATQLSRSALASLDAAALPPAQIVTYKSFDGTLISALLWVPFNLDRNGKNPGVVLPHGGPTGQTVDTFNRNAAALVSRGYTLLAPNVRGSTGYGMAFQKMNYQDLGGADLQDEVYGAKFLAATGYVDAKKIGIAGGSYGGFMTLMAIGKTPDVWAAAVDLFGIVDWYTMLQHGDPRLQEYEKSLLGDPVKDRAVYENTSPIKHLAKATAPLLVLQGENDPRVPKEESEQVVSILQKAGKTVDAHYYPAEGHGFLKRENQIDSVKRMVDWFEKYLK